MTERRIKITFFHNRCLVQIDTENDASFKLWFCLHENLRRHISETSSGICYTKPNRYNNLIDDEIEQHMELFKEVQENSLNIDAAVGRRRKNFVGEYYQNLNVLADTYSSLDGQNAIISLGAKCLSTVGAYDCTLEISARQRRLSRNLMTYKIQHHCTVLVLYGWRTE